MPRSGGGGSHSGGSHGGSRGGSRSSSGSRSHSGGGGSHSGYRSSGSSRGSIGGSYRSYSGGRGSSGRSTGSAGPRNNGGFGGSIGVFGKRPEPRSTHYFTGATRYIYYDKRGTAHNYYSTKAPEKPRKFVLVLKLVLAFIIGIFGVGFLAISRTAPEKIASAPAPAAVIDDTHIFTDTESARQRLQEFTDRTGITAYIVAIRNEEWMPHYQELETCAYEYYINLFDNEKSLLILYSEPTEKDPVFNDWFFEIIYGDNTVKLLTDSKIGDLRDGIQKGLLKKNNRPEQAISEAVAKIGAGMMDAYTDHFAIVMGVIFVAWAIFIVWKNTGKYQKQALVAGAVEVAKDAGELTCAYCGTHYVAGSVTNCRGCGAPVRLTGNGTTPAEKQTRE